MTVLMNKKAEIKNRIDLINRGEVPEGYKKVHGYIIPKDWQESPLIDMCTKRQEKAGCKKLETLSISAGIGFVNQAEKFGRELSGEQYKNYTVIRTGDFSYNKGNSKKYPQGCIYLLKDREIAAVPNVFNTFRLYDFYNNEYYMFLFCSGYLNKQLFKWINFGVRNDGLLNLYDEDFYKSILPIPSQQEQEKIAKILNCCDKVIELKQKLLEEISKEKSILMAKVFKSPQKMIKLSKLANVIMGQSPNSQNYNNENLGMPLIQGNADCENRFTKPRLWTTEITKQCQIGDIIMSVRAPAGTVSISRQNACIGRGVCSIRAKSYTDILYQYLIYIEPKWKRFVQGSTFEAINSSDINNLLVPIIGEKEQEKISNVFNLIDKKIELLSYELEQHKQLKKALSQLLLTGIVRTVEVDCEN